MPTQVPATTPTLRDTPVILPSVYPFEINMTNRKGNVAPAIYIVSDLGRTTDVQQIDLDIKNTSADAYQVGAFTLSFRKGTLHEDLAEGDAKPFCDKLKAAVETAFGSSTGPIVTTEKQGNTISFKVKATSANFSFLANTSVTIALSGIYAAPGTGTRTSGYEVKFEEVRKMVGGNPTDPAFSFSRNAVLQVINHQGVSYAPVHFGVLGNNFLLNEYGGQAIAIFMQSLDGKELTISKETKFIFGFYASENKEGKSPGYDGNLAFGNASEVNNISLGQLPPGFQADPNYTSTVDEHGRRDIIIVPDGEKSASFLTFPFDNIKLSGNPGLVKVYVAVENLPGYWDATFEVTFIKGPMVMAEGQVGINTLPVAGNALSVKGDTSLDGKVDIGGDLTLSQTTFFKMDCPVGIGTTQVGLNKLSVKGWANFNGGVKIEGSLDVESIDIRKGRPARLSWVIISSRLSIGGEIIVSPETGFDVGLVKRIDEKCFKISTVGELNSMCFVIGHGLTIKHPVTFDRQNPHSITIEILEVLTKADNWYIAILSP
ncbi:MAG TPA: hypothetical protein PKA00_19030 [Saprospiraceae bacterium]|nr:hypothetical protein [Saprospiraceae bacterium]HMQ85013.1 hypothetical protein [Saprospiraceae bacterium]